MGFGEYFGDELTWYCDESGILWWEEVQGYHYKGGVYWYFWDYDQVAFEKCGRGGSEFYQAEGGNS